MSSDIHVEIAELQDEITSYLSNIPHKSIVFTFDEVEGKSKLDVVTVNPKHRQSFLFHSAIGNDKVHALKKMLNYVKNYKEKESSFTIQWSLKESKELHTSYFRASTIMDALDKFYYGRDLNSIVVFSVVLNPIS